MTEPLWSTVDAITKPTSMRLWRAERSVEEPGDLFADYLTRRVGSCDVAAYRASMRNHGTVPSLWAQAQQALYKTGETLDGNRSPLRTRSPADVALMMVMRDIRELVAEFFKQDDKADVPTVEQLPEKLRHMASEILRRQAGVDLWGYRLEQFRRLLESHLQAVDRGPKPMRLRVRCPLCKTETITITDLEGNEIVARPILAVYRDGGLRCMECQACTATWWPGAGIHELQAAIQDDEDSRRPQIEEISA
jgi:hypothetical protein